MTAIYRTLRTIEVVGTLEFINNQKQNDQLKGTKVMTVNGVKCYLHSEYLGEPTLLQSGGDTNDNNKE